MQPLWRLHTCGGVYTNKAWNLRKILGEIKEENCTKMVIFINIDVREILARHKSTNPKATPALVS